MESDSIGMSHLASAIRSERRAVPNASFEFTPVEPAKITLSKLPMDAQSQTEDLYMPGEFRSDTGPQQNIRTCDEIFQTVHRPDSAKGLHTAEPPNVSATALWLQSAKHTSTPSIPTDAKGRTEDIYIPGLYRSDSGPPHNQRSYDAIFQTVRRPDGSKALHSADPLDVGATALWVQLGKHTSSPAMVAIYLLRREVERKLWLALPGARAALLLELQSLHHRERDIHAVELQSEHREAARLAGTIFKEAWARLDYQRKSDKLLVQVSNDIQQRLDVVVEVPAPPKTN